MDDIQEHQSTPAAHPADPSPSAPPSPDPSSSSSPSSPPTLPPIPYPGGVPDLDALLRAAAPPAPVPPPGGRNPFPKSARPSMEQIDERCWIRTRQTNARRALGREPQTVAWCYLNLRSAVADLVPVPGTVNSFVARDVAPGSPDSQRAAGGGKEKGKGKQKDVVAEGSPEYHWPWLDGRYLYIAHGREAVARHMKEMGGVAAEPNAEGKGSRIVRKSGEEEKVGAWETIARIEERCERSEAMARPPGKREEQLMRKAMGLDEDDSERLISLSTLYSVSLQRFHAHILRIYTPFFTQLSRLPQTFTDGTQLQMLETVTTRLTDGSAFTLAGRLWESFNTVQRQLAERRKRNEGGGRGGGAGDGGMSGFGGVQPPVPPSRDDGPRGGSGGEGEAGQAGEAGNDAPSSPSSPQPPSHPNGRRPPPEAGRQIVIACTVM
ncbi:hypothetical protein JCM8547_000869 [Rhodosporidiobolus lusitaniae]